MPNRPATRCRAQGCPALVEGGGFCPTHDKQRRAEWDKNRPSPSKRGYDATWQRFRTMQLARYPLCFKCLTEDRYTPATEVHHILPITDHSELRLDEGNVMSLCKACHSAITMRESVSKT